MGELPELDEEATLCIAELVLGMADVDEFLSLCLGRTALNNINKVFRSQPTMVLLKLN